MSNFGLYTSEMMSTVHPKYNILPVRSVLQYAVGLGSMNIRLLYLFHVCVFCLFHKIVQYLYFKLELANFCAATK